MIFFAKFNVSCTDGRAHDSVTFRSERKLVYLSLLGSKTFLCIQHMLRKYKLWMFLLQNHHHARANFIGDELEKGCEFCQRDTIFINVFLLFTLSLHCYNPYQNHFYLSTSSSLLIIISFNILNLQCMPKFFEHLLRFTA